MISCESMVWLCLWILVSVPPRQMQYWRNHSVSFIFNILLGFDQPPQSSSCPGGVTWHRLETFSWPFVASSFVFQFFLFFLYHFQEVVHHIRPLTCRMVVLIEAQGPKYGSRGQTQNFLDLEVSAAPHLHHAEPASSAQCDLDPGLAGTPPDCVCDWATREV